MKEGSQKAAGPDAANGSRKIPPSLKVVPTVYPASPPLEEVAEHYWDAGPAFETVELEIMPPDRPLAILEQLGPSPFPRGGFPLVGFLATTYDRVSRYALQRG